MANSHVEVHRGRRIKAVFIAANSRGWQVAVTIGGTDRRTTCIFPPQVHSELSIGALGSGIEYAKRWIERFHRCQPAR
jgi:hypothetical protein